MNSTWGIALFVSGLGLAALGQRWTTITPPVLSEVSFVCTVIGMCLAGFVILNWLREFFRTL